MGTNDVRICHGLSILLEEESLAVTEMGVN